MVISRSIQTGAFLAIVLCAGLLTGCEEELADAPYLEFAGGGFIFNYNVAEAHYGFVARVMRKLPPGVVFEAEFENPDGGGAFIVAQPARPGRIEYTFRSPPVSGVVTDRDYRVELRLLDGDSREIIARYPRTFRSDIDQSLLPAAPTTIGPGYQPSPASKK